MSERFDELTRRLATTERSEDETGGGTSRRSFIARVAGAAAALGGGLVAAPRTSVAAPRRCTNREPRYKIAKEDGVVEDALGERFVKKGEFIVLESPLCSSSDDGGRGGVTPSNTASECGVGRYNPGFTGTQLGRGWTTLNCRACPHTGSRIDATLYPGNHISLSYATADGQTICYAAGSVASSVWYRTAGTIGCWIWSGATQHTNWNTRCPY